jgi:hypothetical protein
VRIEAEMKTPSSSSSLPVAYAPSHDGEAGNDQDDPLGAGEADDLVPGLQKQGIVSYHLLEEGPHVLAVTVSYTETTATAGRVRSFRKLYQFVARPALVVRTKISAMKGGWTLEAQVENVGEEGCVLRGVELESEEWCRSRSLEELWESCGGVYKGIQDGDRVKVVLPRGGVHQAAFFVQAREGVEKPEGAYLGVLRIRWRGPMGSVGELSTGWLGIRGR